MGAPVNIKLDEATATQIAETVLVKVYGEKVLAQKPWKVREEEDAFALEGTPTTAKGGVATIKIKKSNAEVTSIIHGK